MFDLRRKRSACKRMPDGTLIVLAFCRASSRTGAQGGHLVTKGKARQSSGTAFLGGISRDRFGTMLADTLAREGIDHRLLVRADWLSTICAIATTCDGQPSYTFHGEGAADRSLELSDLPGLVRRAGRHVTCTVLA